MGIKSLFHRPEKFTTMDSMSPADKSRDTWDKRDGRFIVQNYNLRRIIIGLLFISGILTVGLIYQSSKSQLVPYVVEVDKSTGQVLNAGVLKESNYTPQEAEIKYFLSKFIINSRGIPLDPVVYKSQLRSAYAFLTKDGAAKFDSDIKSEKTMEKFGHKTVQINITSVLPVDNGKMTDEGKHYQIRWNEEEYTIGGSDKVTIPMSGIFTVKNIHIKDEKALEDNPLSLYISDFSWSKDASAVNATTKTNVK